MQSVNLWSLQFQTKTQSISWYSNKQSRVWNNAIKQARFDHIFPFHFQHNFVVDIERETSVLKTDTAATEKNVSIKVSNRDAYVCIAECIESNGNFIVKHTNRINWQWGYVSGIATIDWRKFHQCISHRMHRWWMYWRSCNTWLPNRRIWIILWHSVCWSASWQISLCGKWSIKWNYSIHVSEIRRRKRKQRVKEKHIISFFLFILQSAYVS